MKFDYLGSWYYHIKSIKQFDRFITDALPDNALWVEGSFEISIEEFMEIAKEYDTAIMHFAQEQPTKKQRAAGAKPIPDKIGLIVDAKGKHFKQR